VRSSTTPSIAGTFGGEEQLILADESSAGDLIAP
jgi:hypothetical protein